MRGSPHLSLRAAIWHMLTLGIACAATIAWIYLAAPAGVR